MTIPVIVIALPVAAPRPLGRRREFRARPTACDFFAFRNEIFDCLVRIGNGASIHLDNLPHVA